MTGLYPVDDTGRDRTSDLPFGLVYRVEPTSCQLELARTIDGPQWVMIDIDIAERFVRQGHCASSLFPEHVRVVTTTTIADRKGARYHLERELDAVKAFGPRCHIPCDRPVYITQGKDERLWMVRTYLDEVARFVEEAKGVPVIPLVKGVERDERELCYGRFRALGIDYISYYVGQYYKQRGGHVVNDIISIISESGFRRVMLIGLQSKRRLRRLPPQVVALAGHRWRRESGLGRREPENVRERLDEWRSDTESYIATGQCVLET